MLLIALISSCKKNDNDDNANWNTPLRIASYNIQYDNLSTSPIGPWANRKEAFKALVTKYDFDIIGAQEPYLFQLNDIKTMLPQYDYIGVNIDGGTTGARRHYTPIIYKKDKFEILDWGTFWFSSDSSTPGSIGWDAYSPRICTRALIKDKTTGKIFNFFNVHLDHIGVTARNMSIQMLLSLVPLSSAKYPVVVTGDFNQNQNTTNYTKIKNSGILKDSYDLAANRINGDKGTFNNYEVNSTNTSRIDHIFLSTGLPLKVKSYQIITDTFNGQYPSDHNPVMIELQLPK